MHISRITLGLAILIMLTLVGFQYFGNKKPNPKINNLNVGIVTWIGYGPLFIGREMGFFRDRGVNLTIKVLDAPGTRVAAYSAGEIDLFPNTPDAFVILGANRKLEGKIILALDESRGADGLVVKDTITSIANLKGKNIGFQKAITSHFFLLYLLDKAGLKASDVEQTELGAGEAGAAFMAGRLDAAVTWEPWLSKAKLNRETNVLATSADTPGLLADVLLASPSALKRRKALCAFVDGWYEAVKYAKTKPDHAASIVAKSFKLSTAEVVEMFNTVHFFSREDGLSYFTNSDEEMDIYDVINSATNLFQQASVINTRPQIGKLVDKSFIDGKSCTK